MVMKEQQQANVFACILAGGRGVRMGNPDTPKQYMMLGSAPVLIHTLEKFCTIDRFSAVIVLCPATWVQQTQDLIAHYGIDDERVVVIPGGVDRNETIMQGIAYIESRDQLDDQTIVVTHDAVRPFVSYRMITQSIQQAETCGACDTVIAASDTIVSSTSGTTIDDIPDRHRMYCGQTPQTFKAQRFSQLYRQLDTSDKNQLTDACKVFTLAGDTVALIPGDTSNIKITYPQDIRIARAMMDDATSAPAPAIASVPADEALHA
mgnify:CR=1 FL=1